MENSEEKIRSSEYRGVFYVKRINLWSSEITVNGKLMYLGLYDSEIGAAYRYDLEVYLIGDGRLQNF